jgi:hypothetical protein
MRWIDWRNTNENQSTIRHFTGWLSGGRPYTST